ncbi:S41 family peptidase [Mucilaginibacter sp. BT774]|uniref:S41 family peptidase n=1 Tax=Mucilaginibacter sp. BT774 TaxID=3062276 RepID=UPI0026774D05|nr:S41 family peptidase [Mucilaginibacter sp. BT774]MDO3628892.1 S41 family peptidase [Mucilaginibacter sp. BT774]
MKRFFYLTFALGVLFFTACKSNKKSNPSPVGPDAPGTTLDKIKDSVFLYAKEDYLWYNSLPTYATFNPRSFTGADDITALTNEVNAISQYAINPATSQPYEYYSDGPGEAKYSFIDDGTVSGELNGVHGDFGFAPFYNLVNDLRVKYVYPGSPADLAGIKRGYQITSINGNSSVSYDGPGYGNSTNLNFVINAYSNSNTISMTLKKPDGTTLTVANMNVSTYTVNPVLKDTVFDQGNGHKVGYIVFNSFTSGANADPKLDPVFADFAAQGVTDLVVDLRYNGGGYVSTAEHIDNLIVPSSKSGTLMYNTYYNDILTNGKEVLLKNQWRKDQTTGQDYNYGQFSYSVADNAVNFTKAGSLNVNRVFFIITGSTASASELTINNLRPVMDVQFIGETSYGKPVGFFDIDINKYQMYVPEFYTQNSAGQGGYYGGFTPGTSTYPGVADYDDVTKDFGDPTEGLLAHVLNYVKTGTYAVKTQAIQSVQAKYGTFSMAVQTAAAHKMDQHKFTGMIFNNIKKKK